MSEREHRTLQSSDPAQKLAHSIADVTRLTAIGRSFVYEEIKAGRLLTRKAGRRTLIFDADLKAWLAALPNQRVGRFSSQ